MCLVLGAGFAAHLQHQDWAIRKSLQQPAGLRYLGRTYLLHCDDCGRCSAPPPASAFGKTISHTWVSRSTRPVRLGCVHGDVDTFRLSPGNHLAGIIDRTSRVADVLAYEAKSWERAGYGNRTRLNQLGRLTPDR